ncbi:MAG: threonine synthase, partial [Clostridia bacterium]|nr:threonine synthase [Clostridia bacterium]
MNYISTRNKSVKRTAAQAIVEGIAPDGGLYVPESFPALSDKDWKALYNMDYSQRAAYVLSMFLEDYSLEELNDFTAEAYGRFYGDDPCPITALDNKLFAMELWHGPTCAFKDMALTVLPHLLTAGRKKIGAKDKTLILTATSGDTGKAAMEGFKDVEGTDIIVFYPSQGVSDMQKKQMVTQEGGNVHVCAIDGNFDDAQTAVKTIFTSKDMSDKLALRGYKLSSANSINWGRLAPQIAYYISAYCDLVNGNIVKFGDKVDFCVPTGNFGDILAAYYAMRIGMPVGRLICASNKNNVLTDFINTGVYDIKREFYKTISPSMDILVSSNLERLLFEISGRDDALTAQRMNELKSQGKYSISEKELKAMRNLFEGGYTDEKNTKATIKRIYDDYGYLIDPHTAVAFGVYNSADKSDVPCV